MDVHAARLLQWLDATSVEPVMASVHRAMHNNTESCLTGMVLAVSIPLRVDCIALAADDPELAQHVLSSPCQLGSAASNLIRQRLPQGDIDSSVHDSSHSVLQAVRVVLELTQVWLLRMVRKRIRTRVHSCPARCSCMHTQ